MFLELIGGDFDPAPTTKVVGFVDIFLMALVSLNSDQRVRSDPQISTVVRLG